MEQALHREFVLKTNFVLINEKDSCDKTHLASVLYTVRIAILCCILGDFIMKRFKAVVVGCGPRGRDHAKCFLKNSERFELAGICDQDGARLETTHGELKAA